MSADFDRDSAMASSEGEDCPDSIPSTPASTTMTSTPPRTSTPPPPHRPSSSSLLSPPPSNPRNTMPATPPQTSAAATAASGTTTTMVGASGGANANGKRPLNTISNGVDDDEDDHLVIHTAISGAGKLRQQLDSSLSATATSTAAAAGAAANAAAAPKHVHQPSGYAWTQPEDEPGAAWRTKKAMDEYSRAVDGMLHRESMVLGRYGDPFEAVEREKAVLNSLAQR